MQVNRIAECSKGSILQYFGPSLSYHLSLRSLFGLYSSGPFTQVSLQSQDKASFYTICLQIRVCSVKLCVFFLFSNKAYVVGTQKNSLNETVLLST